MPEQMQVYLAQKIEEAQAMQMRAAEPAQRMHFVAGDRIRWHLCADFSQSGAVAGFSPSSRNCE